MLLKDLVYAIRQHTAAQTGTKPSVGHTYELLAALLGYDSFASLNSLSFLVWLSGSDARMIKNVREQLGGFPDLDRAIKRHGALNAAGEARAIGQAMQRFVSDQELVAVSQAHLIALYDPSGDLDYSIDAALEQLLDAIPELESSQQQLTLGMLSTCCAKNQSLHYPTFQIVQKMLDMREDDPYWLVRQRAGTPLSQAEQVFADEALFSEYLTDQAAFHLAAAVAAGNPDAIIETIQHSIDTNVSLTRDMFRPLDQHVRVAGIPSRAMYLAEQVGLTSEVLLWAGRAALFGDTNAMRMLVLQAIETPTVETWTWIYLSRLMGQDVTASTLRAYHDGGMHDGEEFDDDQGGNLYVDGDEALDIRPLSADLDTQATIEAGRLFDLLDNRLKPKWSR